MRVLSAHISYVDGNGNIVEDEYYTEKDGLQIEDVTSMIQEQEPFHDNTVVVIMKLK